MFVWLSSSNNSKETYFTFLPSHGIDLLKLLVQLKWYGHCPHSNLVCYCPCVTIHRYFNLMVHSKVQNLIMSLQSIICHHQLILYHSKLYKWIHDQLFFQFKWLQYKPTLGSTEVIIFLTGSGKSIASRYSSKFSLLTCLKQPTIASDILGNEIPSSFIDLSVSMSCWEIGYKGAKSISHMN